MPLELAISLLGSAVLCGVLAGTLRLHEQAMELRHQLRRVEAWHSDFGYTSRALGTLAQVQKLAESGVGIGTDTVRGIHHGIASIPFGILEAIPATRDTTRIVRAIHDQTADTVYGAIGLVNRMLGKGLRRGMGVDPSKEEPYRGMISDAEMVDFRHFIDTRPDPAEFRLRYPDVVLVVPGDIVTADYRADRSRFHALVDEGGRISGGEFR
ncbi:hypothetical protein D0B54_23940 [Solimonas sp. K1W22B-7]|uniref:hypothetical protein n=1 Tax=Solimonas sp. K1W22B-7 TaxID=2303331 RepID=UPI000E336D77|nr:hypothetical protein [Solimonas sp. K1W22B-7]AXQ31549.1 hypothetical protein D0B54_23940 [Solimonas sp. K1W22B-7]